MIIWSVLTSSNCCLLACIILHIIIDLSHWQACCSRCCRCSLVGCMVHLSRCVSQLFSGVWSCLERTSTLSMLITTDDKHVSGLVNGKTTFESCWQWYIINSNSTHPFVQSIQWIQLTFGFGTVAWCNHFVKQSDTNQMKGTDTIIWGNVLTRPASMMQTWRMFI